jgi:hypothetical protein
MRHADKALDERLLHIKQALDLVTRQTVELLRLAATAADDSLKIKPSHPARYIRETP